MIDILSVEYKEEQLKKPPGYVHDFHHIIYELEDGYDFLIKMASGCDTRLTTEPASIFRCCISPSVSPQASRLTSMDELIRQLRVLFSQEPVAIEDVEKLLSLYKSRRSDWDKFAHFDDRHYTRNLVDTGDGRYNMLLLCWGPGMCTNIHDHSGSHCFVKVLEGQLMETRFAFPTSDDIGPLQNIGESIAFENDVTYMSDSLGLHRMENPSHCEPAVSLHIYSPAYDMCHLFDQRTSQRHVSQVTFWSRYGKRVDEQAPFDAIRPDIVDRPSSSKG